MIKHQEIKDSKIKMSNSLLTCKSKKANSREVKNETNFNLVDQFLKHQNQKKKQNEELNMNKIITFTNTYINQVQTLER
jgi:hypothetical protein